MRTDVAKRVKTEVYIGAIVVAGLAALATSVMNWRIASWPGFLTYLAISVFASGFKLRLPGVTGTVSAAFFPVLIGIVCFSVPEALIAGCASVLTQCIWHSRRRQFLKVVFNISSVALAVAAAATVHRSPWMQGTQAGFAAHLAILGITYFVANTLPVCGVIALTEGKSILQVWRNSCFWSLPHYLAGAAAAGLFELTRRQLGWETSLLFIPVICLLYRASSLHVGRIDDAIQHAERTADLYLRTITSLAAAVDAKDTETYEHLKRVQVYALEIGKELRLSQNEMDALRAAALLHDIGKIAVPDHVIGKPGKLTIAEFQKMKIHTVVGAEILERVRFPFPVAPIVRCHHEKWDGSGYPAGLAGEAIPIGARILSAVDCLDALATDRHYRRALPLDQAMAMVERGSGTAFDPQIVEVLRRRYRELEEKARLATPLLEPSHLSTDICIERGAAPGTGFADAPLPVERLEARSPGAISDLAGLRCFLESVTSGERFLSLTEVLSIATDRLARMVPFDSVAIYVARGGMLQPIHAAGNHRAALEGLRIPLGQGVSGWAMDVNRPILNGNPGLELRYSAIPFELPSPGSALCLPLPGAAGPVGVLSFYGSGENLFTAHHLSAIAGLAPLLGRCLEHEFHTCEPLMPAVTEIPTLIQ